MLTHGPLAADTLHLCIDMQRVFAEDTPWHTSWMPRVLPVVVRLVEASPERTVFTRFMPVRRPEDAHGAWRRYYNRWAELTLDRAGSALFDIVPELASFCPPAQIFDKSTYAPWGAAAFDRAMAERHPSTLIITGTETDVCVLATILGAVDRGYRVIVPTDAICSSSDATHDALLALYHHRYAEQIETATSEEILAGWPSTPRD